MIARIKVDEDLPKDVADRLRAEGHDACTVRDQDKVGVADIELWKYRSE